MPCLIAPLASLAPRGSRLGARLLRRRSQTIRRVCSFLLSTAGARSDARSSTKFEIGFGSRASQGVTVTPWQTASVVGRCSSSTAAARPPRAGILAAEFDVLPVRSTSSSEESCQTSPHRALRRAQGARPQTQGARIWAQGARNRPRSVREHRPYRFSNPARCPSTAIGRSPQSIFRIGHGPRA
jgi:hypothetical protein